MTVSHPVDAFVELELDASSRHHVVFVREDGVHGELGKKSCKFEDVELFTARDLLTLRTHHRSLQEPPHTAQSLTSFCCRQML